LVFAFWQASATTFSISLAGYARTSTIKQRAGYEKVFGEQLSSVDAKRDQLEAAIEFAQEGDVLVVTKIDRLARSIKDLCEIEARLSARAQSFRYSARPWTPARQPDGSRSAFSALLPSMHLAISCVPESQIFPFPHFWLSVLQERQISL
jgi:DNA invertase Pin-like site-specific DNA recombinase